VAAPKTMAGLPVPKSVRLRQERDRVAAAALPLRMQAMKKKKLMERAQLVKRIGMYRLTNILFIASFFFSLSYFTS